MKTATAGKAIGPSPAERALGACLQSPRWETSPLVALEELLALLGALDGGADLSLGRAQARLERGAGAGAGGEADSAAAFSACEEWLLAQGVAGAGEDWRLGCADISRGTGLIALKAFEQGEAVASVPAGAMLSAGFGRARGAPGSRVRALAEELRDNETLALAAVLLFQAADPGLSLL
jgi:hypothetical protein